jgi:hypothetical protein
MNRRTLLLLSCLALSLGAAEPYLWASPWFLGSCAKDAEQKAEKTRQELRRARPGAPNYVPYPYPKTSDELFKDFVHQFQDSWSQQPSKQIPAPERTLLDLLEQGAVHYKVLEVAEWRAQRCSRAYGKKDLLFMLRLFADTSRTEVARVTLRDSGIMATVDFPSGDGREIQLVDGHRLESFDQAAEAAKSLKLDPKDLQYVAVGSPSLSCYESIPCIAFRQGNRAFLYRSGKIFELKHDRVRISNQKFVHDTPERAEVVKKLKTREHVVSLGGDAMTVAIPVD